MNDTTTKKDTLSPLLSCLNQLNLMAWNDNGSAIRCFFVREMTCAENEHSSTEEKSVAANKTSF